MNRRERRELENDIDDALDELDFEIWYEVNSYHECDTTVFDVEFDYDDDLPDDWDEDVEDVLSEVAEDWGGYYSWDDCTLSISIPDDDD